MNKKTIISKTLLFIFIIIFIITFQSIFGKENVLIGVTTVTAMLMFLSRDLTLNPIKNTFYLVGFNLFLGIGSFLTQFNTFFAIIINFVTIFITVYTLCHNLKTSTYFPFVLQYLFMIATPVGVDRLGIRLSSLIIGALAIIVTQLLINRDRISKQGNKLLVAVCTNILEKIRCINKDKSFINITEQIEIGIIQFKKLVYDKREQNFYLTEEGRIKLNLAIELKKINKLLDEIRQKENHKEILEDIAVVIDNIKICFENEENLNILDDLFDYIFNKYENIHDLEILKLINAVEVIKDSLYRLRILEKKEYNKTNNKETSPRNFTLIYVMKNNFRADSLRFSFAFRYALGAAIGAFISDFFMLSEGRWIFFTVSSLSQPQYELSKQKGKDRIFATIVGTIIVSIVFYFIQNTAIRSALLMLAGYIGSYIPQYRYNMILVTFSAVGSAALLTNAAVLSVTRIVYVIFGAIIALVLSRFVFPYRASDANKEIFNTYRGAIFEMLREVKRLLEGRGNWENMKNLYLIASIAEEKLVANNSANENKRLNEYIDEQDLLVMNLYDLYYLIDKENIRKDNMEKILNDLRELITHENEIKEWDEEILVNQLETTSGMHDKLIISTILEVVNNIKTIEKFNVV